MADDRFLRAQENEDSEWLEFSDTKNRLADVRVRDMDFNEQNEEEIGEEKSAAEHIKTWNINNEPVSFFYRIWQKKMVFYATFWQK